MCKCDIVASGSVVIAGATGMARKYARPLETRPHALHLNNIADVP